MLKNHLKTAFRTLRKNNVYSAINIGGLAISLSAAMLILLWVWDELSYDRMHRQADRIYMLYTTFDAASDQLWPVGPTPLAPYAATEIPAVEAACRINNSTAAVMKPEDNQTFDEIGIHVDTTFFKLFDFRLIEGNRQVPFPNKNSIILTEALAKKYFGHADALGRTVQINTNPAESDRMTPFTVSGIVESFPKNSSIEADFLLPFSIEEDRYTANGSSLDEHWGTFSYPTFFLLKPDAAPLAVAQQLGDLQRRHSDEAFFQTLVYYLQPLSQVHLLDAKGRDRGMQQVRIFAIVAGIILLIACINYVNLITARATRRSKEVGMRKIVGASRADLFWQFITESVVVFVLALLLAIALTYAAIPLYNNLSGKTMIFSLMEPRIWVLFGGTLLSVVLLAGVYPALLLSAFNPATALKGILPGIGRNSSFRKLLVVVQFCCSVVPIIGTLIISRQLEYIRKKDLGYDKENVFRFNQKNFLSRFEAVRTELERQPGIEGVTAASDDISNIDSASGDIEWEGKPAHMANFMINQLSVDHRFPEILGLEIVDGRGFTGTPADTNHILLNETAVAQMGLTEPVVGKPVTFRDKVRTVAGIVRDFHFNHLKLPIGPCVLFVDNLAPLTNMYVKTTNDEAEKALAAVRTLWNRYNNGFAFAYEFLDESYENRYEADIRAGMLFNVFAGIAILISCLGLFGLVTFTAETKVKEIGIRKTLGAGIVDIVLMISKDFLRLVGAALLVAFPIGWWIIERWLENYTYRTAIEWWVFAVAGLAAFAVATLTVCGKSFRAARENPIKALRTE